MKKTSSIIMVTGQTDESGTATLTEEQINLQLNALDREVFVVTDLVLSCPGQPIYVPTGADPSGNYRNTCTAVVSSTSANTIEVNSPNVLGWTKTVTNTAVQVYGPNAGDLVSLGTYEKVTGYQTGAIDGEANPLGIIATPDFYVRVLSGGPAPSAGRADWRLYGYRAQADAATYAALVQSEVLSE